MLALGREGALQSNAEREGEIRLPIFMGLAASRAGNRSRKQRHKIAGAGIHVVRPGKHIGRGDRHGARAGGGSLRRVVVGWQFLNRHRMGFLAPTLSEDVPVAHMHRHAAAKVRQSESGLAIATVVRT